MSYSYDPPYQDDQCIDCEVCRACDGTGGDCLMGECWECNGSGMIHVCRMWDYEEYMEQQTADHQMRKEQA